MFDILENIQKLLLSVNELFWADKVTKLLNKKDMNSIAKKEILLWFGGMGSLNDLVISKMNGHLISPESEEKINMELNKMIIKLYNEITKE